MRRFALASRPARRQAAWQVIYMDLMTIIMVFFVILWSINQREEVGVSETVGEETVKMVSLPGDVLFASGKAKLTREGEQVFGKLFDDPTGNVLNFDTGGLVNRLLVIHGHTDSDGPKDENFELGYERAQSAYEAIRNYSDELENHVVICTHADNSPAQEVPAFRGKTTPAERASIREAKAMNRRITIEDKVVDRFDEAGRVIGAKTITSMLLLTVGGVAAWTMWSPARIAGLDAMTLFWVGVWAGVIGPVFVRFWGLQHASKHGFLYAFDEEPWENEADFLRVGRHRIAIADTDGEALDLPSVMQYSVYIGLAFLVGLLTIDSRAVALIQDLPNQMTLAGSQMCPDPNEESVKEKQESPGCALLRRAFELGYAKDLGPCEPTEEEKQAEICTLRHRDEPLVHYAWRLLEDFWDEMGERTDSSYFNALKETFVDRANDLDTIFNAQTHVMGTGPRASHHIWTNLSHPGSWMHAKTGDTFDPSRCFERFRKMPHRPHLEGVGTKDASRTFEHVLGKLLFEPRYTTAAAYCKEFSIHWEAPSDACEQLKRHPDTFLQQTGASTGVSAVIQRHRVAGRIAKLDSTGLMANSALTRQEGTGKVPKSARPIDRYLSFTCFMVEDRPSAVRSVRFFNHNGYVFRAAELRVPELDNPQSEHIDWYGHLAALLARGFHYGGLMSQASMLPGSDAELLEPMFEGPAFALSRLDYLADMDIFLGHTWVLEREDLRDLYPYHLHLKNYIELFRKQYRAEQGRL